MTLVAVNEDLLPSRESSMDLRNRSVHNLIRDIRRIGSIHKIQDEPVVPLGNQIFRVVFGYRSARVAECLTMIRFLAGLDHQPRSEFVATHLVVILRTYEQIGIDLNHAGQPLS